MEGVETEAGVLDDLLTKNWGDFYMAWFHRYIKQGSVSPTDFEISCMSLGYSV